MNIVPVYPENLDFKIQGELLEAGLWKIIKYAEKSSHEIMLFHIVHFGRILGTVLITKNEMEVHLHERKFAQFFEKYPLKRRGLKKTKKTINSSRTYSSSKTDVESAS